jgi:N-acetylglucosaminyldiphosphoundecaprenol N-acetyl-beta-D-mannosaminyltransferase
VDERSEYRVPDRVDVLGVGFDRIDLPTAIARILERLDRGERTFVVTANPEFVMLARSDAEVARLAHDADIVVPDGTGVAIAASLLGSPLPRVPGRMLVDAIVPALAQRGASLFLLGAAPGVAERAADTLRSREPRLIVAGCYSGLAEDDADTAAQVRAVSPAVVLVAYGMPKQERWIARNLASLSSVRLAIGVGGVLDQLAGVQKVPPPILHRLGLEWLWRLLREPWRWRRQRVLPLFAALVLRKRITGR